MKNILHLTFDMRIGGTEQVIKNLIDGADTNEFENSIFCIESPIGPFGKMLMDKGIHIHFEARQQGFDFQLVKSIRKYINYHKVDILHCHQYTPWVYGTIGAMFTKTKIVFTEHGRFYPDSSTWKRKLVNPILNLFTDSVVAISEATKQALVEFENIPRRSINVIYNGIAELNVDIEKVKQLKLSLNLDEDKIILGTIARFDPIKNHKMMLKAFAEVLKKNSNAILLIVGDGDERESIEALIRELNITDNIILTGYNPNPKHYLAMMDIYLLSSFSEGTSMTLLEAMSLGKPCVVTDAGGNAEIIKHKENGLVTDNDNLEQFTDCCNELIADTVKQKLYGEAGRKIFEENFSLNNMLNRYRALYET
ncbi:MULTISPECIES: glycosyltransferase [unclassified Colwellia]|uniref:glycosyltransferase n=1 Tax=unclassified Colwellia TaxID=196834 RepID=UPI0015F491C5|nr:MULTISPECIES: glycosyltransferase [unclassified Colwellia]MBA6377930.1 glycosyltransferase [Colwellia sp. BRX10-7]MBA6387604.1 glycosyltransferase [Colwellia sp. BRX10-2]MBA6400938.1 glycosyltransferase [Colwellia sp. BRX10-5]MBA6404782.1 glycosyltransferase [Colwellia sp. BRX10-1]